MQIAQLSLVQIQKSQCLSDREFPEFFKTHPTFILNPILRPVEAKNLPASLSVVGCTLKKCSNSERKFSFSSFVDCSL